jgi:hypothetical protein
VFVYDQKKRYVVSLNADGIKAFLDTLSKKSGIPAK